jgi:oligopeptide transport system ATP-binding protein
VNKLTKAFELAMSLGQDLKDPKVLNEIFEVVAFRVEFRSFDEETQTIHGYAIIDCAKVKYTNDWQQIRGCRIATVFQDPMTSLNPVITIGKQIMTVILKHQKCSNQEAKERTIDIMRKVGIPEPEKRFNDYPFEYSGGMRQRIVIAIALSCQPKILICDEPTTALDVTIQAQILRLIKDLQEELGFTTVYITHDLGVVANVAERVAVIYGGQIVEVGTVEEIFYDPRHPYTWALLSSLPQLAERGTELFSIPGTPPSLYNKIVGDAFAPRNQYALSIDYVKEAPMFKVSETHYAKTWLLDPRAPKTELPENIRNLHEKMLKTYVDFGSEEATHGSK